MDFAEQLLRNIVANAKLHNGLFSAHYTVHPDEINAARLWLSALDEKAANRENAARTYVRNGFPPFKDSP